MSTPLYPLKFKTIFKDKIWGGHKIESYLHKNIGDLPNCGETWEISGVKSDVSVVDSGELKGQSLADLLEQYQADLVGDKVYKHFGNTFPLLVKFIDANDDLSVQVHPNDELAKKRHNSFGKTEMWYIIEADPGSTLITGFNQEMDEQKYVNALNSGHIMDILNREEAKAGDVFFLPAGRVHTIGKGLLIAEIQQTSDITYRIYDFDRVDDKGNKRELHTQEALAAIDYKHYDEYKTLYQPQKDETVHVVSCPYFTTNVLDATHGTEKDYSNLDSFVIHVCVEGEYTLQHNDLAYQVKMGDCILLPKTIDKVVLKTTAGFKILESYIE
ncbi:MULTISPECIES: type I phosphomannose isomerase catalytic subunit [unclassified Mucilaginibacter]|uniref:type I phosphomannose isomerase catalytic subunit n=1 Tax=unclassified Mucilaginibacter TaxID=2617802 RepID=UPI0009628713|nr:MULTISPECIES: type I phosphomannose isomerase catalytic subunit [unclassified Mucilaginibacter]OJW12992.1 MAG: mannose-6-phosphate isomerase [Mucilaginibacter sp. 44-25]PLW90173.1 MAG: mannose-6-phosphate isomerase [Mucilaginibacter sp.]HEK20728.1 mannose-6-phosphate isomerase [Bacteroidota bacterium]